MSLWIWVTVASAGAAGQMMDAVAGMGFGALSSTAMVAGGVSPVLAVSMINVAKVGSGLASGLSHWRFGNVRWSWVLPLALTGIAGGVVGAFLLTQVPTDVTRLGVPILLLLMGMLTVRRFLSGARPLPRVAGGSVDQDPALPQSIWQRGVHTVGKAYPRVRLGGIGFVAGALNGVSGAWGPFATTAITMSSSHPRYAVGTVNFVEMFVAAAVAATLFLHLGLTGFPWQLAVALVAGSIVTAPLGAFLSRNVPARFLGLFIGITLVGLNVWSIGKALA